MSKNYFLFTYYILLDFIQVSLTLTFSGSCSFFITFTFFSVCVFFHYSLVVIIASLQRAQNHCPLIAKPTFFPSLQMLWPAIAFLALHKPPPSALSVSFNTSHRQDYSYNH